jgi:hypothetical protein
MTRTATTKLAHWLQDEFGSDRLLPGLTSGLLMGVTEVFAALSLGSLVFSGELAPYLPYGIGMALFTTAIMLITTSLTSRVPGVMGSTQNTSSVTLAVIAAGLAGTLSAAGTADKLTTVLVAIAVTTLLRYSPWSGIRPLPPGTLRTAPRGTGLPCAPRTARSGCGTHPPANLSPRCAPTSRTRGRWWLSAKTALAWP